MTVITFQLAKTEYKMSLCACLPALFYRKSEEEMNAQFSLLGSDTYIVTA